jgi:serine/threonine-protein kinase
MAELFLARLPGIEGFDKKVVIKRVLPSLARDRDFIEMFLEEARLAATLHHQNIVQVHDIGQDEDGYFFAMEHLLGIDVGELMRVVSRQDGLPLEIALEIARGACAGLHHAHERTSPAGGPLGIVHRDVSPQNLFVTFDGGVKLLDFGIAKAVQQSTSHLTRSGTLRGKLPYMSPEQCQGVPIDRRSDVFSLGVVLWEMTVGERLFGGTRESDFEILKSIVEQDAPRPSSRAPHYPQALEVIVRKSLQRDPARRHQTCDELQGELEGFIRSQGTWATARDVARFMAKHFGDRLPPAVEDRPGGEIVPFPRPTRALPAPKTEATVDLHPTPPASRPRRILPWAAAAVAIAAAALAAGFWIGRGGQKVAEPGADPAKASPAGATAPTTKPREDALWFQPDDFLVAGGPFTGKGRLQPLAVSKRLGEPDLHGEAEFLTASGQRLRATTYWTTHRAAPGELAIGRLAFCPQPGYTASVCPVPGDKRQAREGQWLAGLITDLAEVPAGKVMVSDCLCDVAGVRIPDPD